MRGIDWKSILIGIVLGMYVVPMVLGKIMSRRAA